MMVRLFLSVLIILLSVLLFITVEAQASSNPNPNNEKLPPLMKIINNVPMIYNGTTGAYTDEVITPSHLFQQVDPDLELALDPNI